MRSTLRLALRKRGFSLCGEVNDFEGIMGWLGKLKSFFSRSSVQPASIRRLDGRSKALLAASIEILPYEEPGWITMQEARALFSPADDEYASGEIGEIGKRNLATFAADAIPDCLFEFMPVEDRVYFIRRAKPRPAGAPESNEEHRA